MVINPITAIGTAASQPNIQRITDKIQATISSLITGNRSITDDVAALSVATQLQTGLTALREVSGNVAQNVSLLQVADGGVEKIGGLVEQLRELALQAKSPTVNQTTRDSLNDQFKQIVTEIDRIAKNTKFGGKNLLDGSISGENNLSVSNVFAGGGTGGASISISDLSTNSLFSGQSLDILSVDSQAQALETLSTALGKIATVRADIGAFQQSLGFVAAGIDSAISNQEAARSVLAGSDISEESTIYSLLNAQRNNQVALQAQTNRLPANLIKLVE